MQMNCIPASRFALSSQRRESNDDANLCLFKMYLSWHIVAPRAGKEVAESRKFCVEQVMELPNHRGSMQRSNEARITLCLHVVS